MTSKSTPTIDPIPKRGGGPLHPLLSAIIATIALVGGLAVAHWAAEEGGYDEVEMLASIKCLGCLGLDPVVADFSGFWTVYPEGHSKEDQTVDHPQSIRDLLNGSDVDLVILFFWTEGCVPCAEQWKDMVRWDIASGKEDDGREGSKYRKCRLYSLDAAMEEDIFVYIDGRPMPIVPNDLYWKYHHNGNRMDNGVPMTVFIFEKEGTYYWYSHYGKMEVKDVSGLMNDILYHEISGVHG